jgi:hypothetical protein
VTRHPALTAGQLNRAVLARQHLLERSGDPLVRAVERIGGLQAQEPASPYVGMWSRLAGFEAPALDAAFRERRIIKATFVRATLHAVSRDDYRRIFPAVLPMLRRLTRRERGGGPGEAELDRLAAAALAFADRPRSNTDLRTHVAEYADGIEPDDALWFVRRHVPFVHVPGDVPWSFGRRPSLIAAAAWLDGEAFEAEERALEQLVRRYLGAFGPATAADVGAWSGLPVGRFRPALAAIDAGGELRRFSDERGRELLDLTGMPLPAADTPAPVRFLPMWDSLVLAHADRTRVMSDDHRRVVIGSNGDTLPTFLVDGRVAGLWWAEPAGHRDGSAPRIILEPFGRLRAAYRRALDEEGARLATFVGPLEPGVFGRYRRSRARRPPG